MYYHGRICNILNEENVDINTTSVLSLKNHLCVGMTVIAQWAGHCPTNQKIDGLIPHQSTCLGCGSGPRLGVWKATEDVSFSLPSPLSKNKLFWCLIASCVPPTWGLACIPSMCPEGELNWWPLSLQDDTQPTKPHQSGPFVCIYAQEKRPGLMFTS